MVDIRIIILREKYKRLFIILVYMPTAYSDEEKEKIIQYFKDLQNDFIRGFLSQHELPVSGNSDILMGRIEEALDNDTISYEDLVEYLDATIPGGKQHVFLYKGPSRVVLAELEGPAFC